MAKLRKKLRKGVLLGIGIADLSRKAVGKRIGATARKQHISRGEADKVTKDFIRSARAEMARYDKLIEREVEKLMKRAGSKPSVAASKKVSSAKKKKSSGRKKVVKPRSASAVKKKSSRKSAKTKKSVRKTTKSKR